MRTFILLLLLIGTLFGQPPQKIQTRDIQNKAVTWDKLSDVAKSQLRSDMSDSLYYYTVPGINADSTTDDRASIQAVIDHVNGIGGGIVQLPEGYIRLDSTLWIKSNVTLRGTGKKSTILVGDSISSFIRALDADNWTVRDLGILHETYPNDTTMVWDGDYYQSSGIFAKACLSPTIDNVYITGTTNYGIYIGDDGGDNSRYATITNNELYKAHYYSAGINVGNGNETFNYDGTDAFGHKILFNNIKKGCQQKWVNPGTTHDNGNASIKLTYARNCLVQGNQIDSSSSSGIRLEAAPYTRVIDNNTEETGGAGIYVYTYSSDCSIKGNIIRNFGRLPSMKYIRHNGLGDTLITRVYLDTAAGGALNMPTTIEDGDSGWVSYPYVITGTKDSIPQWDTTGLDHFNPFRGFAGIQLTSNIYRNKVIGNTIEGDTTTTNGKYNYASDYGIAVGMHQWNQYTIADGNHTVIGNSVQTVINSTKEIFAPEFEDQVSAINYRKGITERSTIFGNAATVWDWAIQDVLAIGLASQTYNNLRALDTDLENVNSLENQIDRFGAFLGLDPWIFADGFNRNDNDSLGTPKYSDIDSVWITESGEMAIENKKATTDIDGNGAKVTVAISDSDYVMELDIERFTDKQARIYLHWLNDSNYVWFAANGDSTYRLQEVEDDVVTAFASENGKIYVDGDDHWIIHVNDSTYNVWVQNDTYGTNQIMTNKYSTFLSNNTRIGFTCSDSVVTFDNLIIKPYGE